MTARRVDEIMSTDLETAQVGETIDIASTIIALADIRHLPVMAHGELVGIVSDRDLRRAAGLGWRDDRSVEDLMTRDVVTLEPGSRLSAAVRLMVEGKISALPVLEGNDLAGILTTSDALAPCMAHLRANVSGSRP